MPDQALKVSFTREQMEVLKREACNQAPYALRLSLPLAIRLGMQSSEAGSILREIDALEGLRPSTTVKAPSQFRHLPLHPFWHKHFFTSRHAMRNAADHWNIARGQGNRKLDSALKEIAHRDGHDPEQWQKSVAHLLSQGLVERADEKQNNEKKGLTGDWIIYARHLGTNYYLDLAKHEEAEDDARSTRLMEKLRSGCAAEFPFLFSN